ncbi:MAG: hypothetical protein LBQ54_02415 [Planctomycetaceae bacterium]|nr:hypothetical protein [Planctomycetaceae bacterium]
MSVLTGIDIDTIVRRVLTDLNSVRFVSALPVPEKPQQAACQSLPSPSSSKQAIHPPANDILNLTGRLITLATLENQLNGIRKVQVSPVAVVTPAVKDFLRKKNITLERTKDSSNQNAPVRKIWLALHHLQKEPSLLVDDLAKQGDLKCEPFHCIIQTVHAAVDWAKMFPESRLIVVTSFTAAAVCLANRHKELRAVLGNNAAQITQDTKAVNANMMVMNPHGVSPYQLQDFSKAFLLAPNHCGNDLWEAFNRIEDRGQNHENR